VVVLENPEALHPILDTVFNILSRPANRNDTEVRSIRRHCCALMIKLSSKFPAILYSTFQHLNAQITNMQTNSLLSKMEYVTLTEALFIISNQMKNYEQQTQFIKVVSEPVVNQLLSLQPHYSSPEALITFIGLDKEPPPNQPSNGQTNGHSAAPDPLWENRSMLSMVMNFLLAISRRVETNNSDPTAASTINVNGKIFTKHRNAAGTCLSRVLENIFIFGRTINLMFSQQVKERLHPGYLKAFDLMEADKNNILGLPGSRSAKNELTYQIKLPDSVTRIQNFITELFESVQHFLSHMSNTIGFEFYSYPGLVEGLCMSVLGSVQILPDFRLRAINRMFLKNFIINCPEEYFSSVLIPILKQTAPVMRMRLQERWAFLRKIREDPSFDEDNTDSQEVLDDVIIRVTAREYLDMVKAMLTSGANQKDEGGNITSVSNLGELVLLEPGLRTDLMLTCMQGLRGHDSISGTKAAALVELMLPNLMKMNAFTAETAASVMVEILSAFQEMGMHEANNIALTHLALLCYEAFRPCFPDIVMVFQQVPGINHEDLIKFDNKILNTATSFGEKAKKDMFKKLISELIGKDVAKLFKKEIVIKNLPNLIPSKVRPKTASLDEQTDRTGEDTGLVQLFN